MEFTTVISTTFETILALVIAITDTTPSLTFGSIGATCFCQCSAIAISTAISKLWSIEMEFMTIVDSTFKISKTAAIILDVSFIYFVTGTTPFVTFVNIGAT